MNLSYLFAFGWAAVLIGSLLFFLIVTLLVQWLWNSTVCELCKVPAVTLWGAFKILLLTSLLFGGFSLPFNFSVSETTTLGKATRTVTYGVGSSKK